MSPPCIILHKTTCNAVQSIFETAIIVLDPLTAIGLAGNVVQLVDFSYDLVPETRDIYYSKSGISTRNAQL
jgi:hypothetical protein